ncbi:MAG: hypothetical protein ACRDU9_09245 [Acidimicrobiia bacterium]
MRRTLVAVLLVVVACSPGETTGSSTSSTSTSLVTTTSAPVTTTTSPLPTTTTTQLTTTTVAGTTTTSLLSGNWADEPLVTTDFGALGWWDGSDWLDAETQGALPVVGGEDYQVIRLDFLGTTTGGPQTTVCEPLELIGVELDDPDLLGEFPGPYGIAISAPWTLQPHLFELATDDGTYSALAAQLLSSRGLDVAGPVIKQLIRTDLEGDGVHEVLVVAEEVTPGVMMEVGDYSIAFMRKVVQGEVQTAVLADTVVLDEDDGFGGAHSVGAVADLNGDGKMEIVLNSAFFEGFGVFASEYVNDDLGPVQILTTGCGS